MYLDLHRREISEKGFSIIDNIFSNGEIDSIISIIEQSENTGANFRRMEGLFAIRRFLAEVPGSLPILFQQKLTSLIKELFGEGYFVVKSIYFDKPESSNWFVAYHQDLTISVDRKTIIDGFGPWTVKQDRFSVQPPLNILRANFTIRIHLDDTNEQNGALRVVPGSHLKGIYRPEKIDWSLEQETICNVPRGGVMIMKPLLLHASGRTVNQQKRRVIHIEFSNQKLPEPLRWAELQEFELNH